jgi:hypothetical protein
VYICPTCNDVVKTPDRDKHKRPLCAEGHIAVFVWSTFASFLSGLGYAVVVFFCAAGLHAVLRPHEAVALPAAVLVLGLGLLPSMVALGKGVKFSSAREPSRCIARSNLGLLLGIVAGYYGFFAAGFHRTLTK